MSRPLKGSIRQRGASWEASVPTLDRKSRVVANFPTDTHAQAWVVAQIDRLARGPEPEPPRTCAGAGRGRWTGRRATRRRAEPTSRRSRRSDDAGR
jgi:hypothetical protein